MWLFAVSLSIGKELGLTSLNGLGQGWFLTEYAWP